MNAGAYWSKKATSWKLRSFEDMPQDLQQGYIVDKVQDGYHSTKAVDKRVFTPFCKGLGIYCNGFWGCGALGPHKCNRSDLSHFIKEV